MFDKITEVNLMYDFYAQLLTDRQREVIRLYHCENFSLAEIGDEFSISRQGVYYTLKNAEKALSEYECKLNLVRKFIYSSSLMKAADERIGALIGENEEDKDLTDKLCGIRKIIDELGQ